MALGCFQLYGRVVVSFTHYLFPFSILFVEKSILAISLKIPDPDVPKRSCPSKNDHKVRNTGEVSNEGLRTVKKLFSFIILSTFIFLLNLCRFPDYYELSRITLQCIDFKQWCTISTLNFIIPDTVTPLINIGRCGVSANETTLHPNNNFKKVNHYRSKYGL